MSEITNAKMIAGLKAIKEITLEHYPYPAAPDLDTGFCHAMGHISSVVDSAIVRHERNLPFRFQWKQTKGWEEIEGKDCVITLERRPHYCDRGNYLAKLHPNGKFALEIDGQDGWPRYYFDIHRAKAEIEDWLKKRGQLLPREEGK